MLTARRPALPASLSATPTEPSHSLQHQTSGHPNTAPLQVIAFASRKGGSGRTTLCSQLAVQAELEGAGPVALVDADPQGSLAQWWNAREAETPVFVKTSLDRLSGDLDQLRGQGIRRVFIDTPPAATESIREIVGHANLVVIPTRPSPHDLRAVGGTLDVVEALNRPLIFVVNGAPPRARITAQAATALSQHGTVAPSAVHQRVDFAVSMIDGRAVMELNPNSRAAAEVAALWQYLSARLGKLERRHLRLPFVGRDRRPAGPVFGRRVRT